MSYTLILTFALLRSTASAVAIESVPGFKTEAACLVAGNAWIAQAQKAGEHAFVSSRVAALCVRDN